MSSSRVRSALVGALAVAVAGAAASCKRTASEPSAAEPGSASAALSSEPPPIDRLGPGELPPGTESAFGMVLPRGLSVIGVFPGVVHASGSLTIEDVSNYVRAHVDLRRVELGAVGTIFPSVHILGGDPQKLYRIEVNAVGPDTHVVFRDVTPKVAPPPEHLTNEEAWRRIGLKPDGTPLDPPKPP